MLGFWELPSHVVVETLDGVQGLCPTMYVKPYQLASLLPQEDQPTYMSSLEGALLRKRGGKTPSQSVTAAPRTVTRTETPSQRQSVSQGVMDHGLVTELPTNKTSQSVSHSVTINNYVERSGIPVAENRADAENRAIASHLASTHAQSLQQAAGSSLERGGGGVGGEAYFSLSEEDCGKCGLGWFR